MHFRVIDLEQDQNINDLTILRWRNATNYKLDRNQADYLKKLWAGKNHGSVNEDEIMSKSKKCPECNSEEVVPIVYGMPGMDSVEKARRGEVQLGGCMIEEDNSTWYCKNCSYEWK